MDESISQNVAGEAAAHGSNDAANLPASNESQSKTSSNVRGKTDPAWKYVVVQVVNGKTRLCCTFCTQSYSGCGINRMKRHFVKIKGEIKPCPNVPFDVIKEMEAVLIEIEKSKKKRKISFSENGEDEVEDAIDQAIAQEKEE
ncbi:hypothetical protein PIB30_066158 [Stylosanthes scabra]|uniref:BED-type domain-containing protein n=1 Tax=Stylosanthes scabra TaxID=79078 RepID=A0ABU6VM23_9FABA|nr:hypothetical protein [Stylosanthes scabra]